MPSDKLNRMIELAEKVFAVKNDPEQLDVTPKVIEKLKAFHPATVSEYNTGDGPVAWVILIPTTFDLMQRFIDCRITEKELYILNPADAKYDALYLCSALVLEEYRRQGIVSRLVMDAIKKIQRDHPLKALFVWPFSEEGHALANAISDMTSLPLYKRTERKAKRT